MNYDVIIIGAGQAGLAMGYQLKKTSLTFLILDRIKEIGEVWKNRYDSLTLFSPRSYSSIPGLLFDGKQEGYPTKDEVANYLSSYAETNSLPIQLNTNVTKLLKSQNGFLIHTNRGDFTSRNVIIATGPFQTPNIPTLSKDLSSNVLQIHSSDYKNRSQLNEGSVLVVGGGNSGAQIAVELAKYKEVYLSVGQKMKFFPQKVGTKSLFWWLDKFGLLNAKIDSKIGQFLSKQPDPIFGYELRDLIKNGKIKLKNRTISVENGYIVFEDQSKVKLDNIIWSTGFVSDYSWLEIDNVINEKNIPIHERGLTSVKGLFFLGLPWQHTRGSGLIYGVGKDAEYLVQYLI